MLYASLIIPDFDVTITTSIWNFGSYSLNGMKQDYL